MCIRDLSILFPSGEKVPLQFSYRMHSLRDIDTNTCIKSFHVFIWIHSKVLTFLLVSSSFSSFFSFSFVIFSVCKFLNSIYKYYICCKFCWERLCGSLRWEWYPCAVVPKASLHRFHHGWWIWETRGFVASYQFCLKTFDDVISLKNVVDDASLWHSRIGSKMGFEERTALMSGTMFGRKAWSWTSRVHVNKACSLSGPWLLVVFTAWGFAISAEIIEVFTYATAHNFVMLQKVDYVCYFHFILAVYLLYSNCI